MSKPKKQDDEVKVEHPENGIAPETITEEAGAQAADEPVAEAADDAGEPDTGEAEPDPLEELRAERDAFEEKWLRAVAEMENVRRRARKDVTDARRFAQADLLRPLLEVYDNFERALQSFDAGEEAQENESGIREGVDLIFQRFRAILKEKGVEPIAALDQEFDPRVHEAVGTLAREGAEDGTVIEVVQPGFQLGDFVLRPARVIVAG